MGWAPYVFFEGYDPSSTGEGWFLGQTVYVPGSNQNSPVHSPSPKIFPVEFKNAYSSLK